MEEYERQPVVFAEVAPSRDLWKGIEARLDQKGRGPIDQLTPVLGPPAAVIPIAAGRANRRGMRYITGIAATLLIAVVAVLAWQQGGVLPAEDGPSLMHMRALAMRENHRENLKPLLEHPIPEDFQSAFATLDTAEAELFVALRTDAKNPALLHMLANVYHQRAELLMKSPAVAGPRTGRQTLERANTLQNETHQQGMYS